MGDRANCELRLFGATTTEKWDDVVAAITDACCDDEDEFYYSFGSVNYAQLDPQLEGAIHRAGLSYIWQNEAGDEYPAGIECWDAETGTGFSSNANGLTLLMELTDVANLPIYQKWQDWILKHAKDPQVVVTE